MKKEYVIGGLAILGAIALVAYIRKPKRNSDGFYNAEGTVYKWCARRNADGSVSYISNQFSDSCPKGYVRAKYFGDRTML